MSNLKINIPGFIGKNGRGKKLVCTGLVLATLMATPVSAYANTPNQNIGVENLDQRASIEQYETNEITNKFQNQVTIEQIKKAIEISDSINSLYAGATDFMVTNCGEIISLDIDSLYSSYLWHRDNGMEANFGAKNLVNVASVDAYALLGCNKICTELKNAISSRMYNVLITEGRPIYGVRTVINHNGVFTLVDYYNEVKMIKLEGELITEIQDTYLSLFNSYNAAINQVKGNDTPYENAFARCGYDIISNWTTYVSVGDDNRKALERNAIELYETILNNPEKFEIKCDNPTESRRYSSKDKEQLRQLGYSENQISNGSKMTATFDKVLEKQFK